MPGVTKPSASEPVDDDKSETGCESLNPSVSGVAPMRPLHKRRDVLAPPLDQIAKESSSKETVLMMASPVQAAPQYDVP
jgi:hypothetical protein